MNGFDWKKYKRNEIAANLLLFEQERINSDTQFDSNCPPGCEDMPDDLFVAVVAEMKEIAAKTKC